MIHRRRLRYIRASMALIRTRRPRDLLLLAFKSPISVLRHERRTGAAGATIRTAGAATVSMAAVLLLWLRRMGSSVLAQLTAAAVRAPAAVEDAEEEEAAEAGGKADDEGEVAVDPGCDFFADGAAFAYALGEC